MDLSEIKRLGSHCRYQDKTSRETQPAHAPDVFGAMLAKIK